MASLQINYRLMKQGAKIAFRVGSVEGIDDLYLLLIMDHVESLGI